MDRLENAAERIGRRIREIRRQKGLTQKQLAEKAGVFDVGELERGRKVKGGTTNPRLETLCRIASALDVEIDVLFGHADVGQEVQRFAELMRDQEVAVKKQAVRLIEVLVADRV